MLSGEYARWHTEAIEVRHDFCTWQLSRRNGDGKDVVMARGSELTWQDARREAGRVYRLLIKEWLNR